MAGSDLHSAVLVRHPKTYSYAVVGIEASVEWVRGTVLKFTYLLNGDLTRIRVPPPGPHRRAHGLWHHTCFEAFVSVPGNAAYDEFNFAPSGEWAVYTFDRYRKGAPLVDREVAPTLTVRKTKQGIELDAEVNQFRRLGMSSQTCLQLGLAAVVEESGGTLSYWALRHPRSKPDFHHSDSFVLKIELPDEERQRGTPVVEKK